MTGFIMVSLIRQVLENLWNSPRYPREENGGGYLFGNVFLQKLKLRHSGLPDGTLLGVL